jgi:hypothetical protein
MRRRIFRQIQCPAAQASLEINEFASWYSWSEDFLLFLIDAKTDLDRLGDPPLVRISRSPRYGSTFSWPLDAWSSTSLRQRCSSFVRSLPDCSKKLMLFDGLLQPGLSGSQLHALFAALRGAIASLYQNESLAMYTPLGDVGNRVRAFPLHCDLYIPHNLFNVFDDVPMDDSGASVFLSVSALKTLLQRSALLPERTARRIIALIESSEKDGFDALYDLLHGEHQWVDELQRSMEPRQLRIKLGSGQGYLLNDRLWLHGRETVRGGVSKNRVHRLVYNTVGHRA